MIAIGCDHVAIELKEEIKKHLSEKGYEYKDFGCFSAERMDYPVIAEAVGKAVVSGECEKGLLFCGSGVGMSIAVNKVKGIRAVLCSEPYSAMMSRAHNDSNVLAMGARVVGPELAKMILDMWLSTEFEGGRHSKRVDMITQIEEGR